MSRTELFLFSFVFLLLAVYGGLYTSQYFFQHKKSPSRQQEIEDVRVATKKIEEERFEEALLLIQKYQHRLVKKSKGSAKWAELLISIHTHHKNSAELLWLYEKFPDLFLFSERASLLLLKTFLVKFDLPSYETLRKKWLHHETKKVDFLNLDVEKLLLEEKRQEAISLLESRLFEGDIPMESVLRLSLLYAQEAPTKALEILNLAYLNNPKNSDILFYKGELLETLGQTDAAIETYQALMNQQPAHYLAQNQLVNCLLRKGHAQAAHAFVEQALLKARYNDALFLKALFIHRTIAPLSIDWSKQLLPDGALKPLLLYLSSLSKETWKENTFSQLKNKETFLRDTQELFWLRLFSALRNKEFESALNLLEFHPFKKFSWGSELEGLLTDLLLYRQEKKEPFAEPLEVKYLAEPREEPNSVYAFFKTFLPTKRTLQFTSEQPYRNFFNSEEAVALLLIEAGFVEAGLTMHPLKGVPADYPALTIPTTLEALVKNNAPAAALEFANKQDNRNMALLFLSDTYVKKGAFDLAKEILQKKSALHKEVAGCELLARIALQEKLPESALKYYQTIAGASVEAKSFLARHAYTQGDFDKALKLIQELIELYPDNTLLKENEQKILAKLSVAE